MNWNDKSVEKSSTFVWGKVSVTRVAENKDRAIDLHAQHINDQKLEESIEMQMQEHQRIIN